MNLEEMNDMLKNGVVSNMCNYIRAREIFLTISDFHQKINDSPYNEFFGAVQLFAKKEMYMSLCKIFEEKNKIYVICSLPNILDILKNSELEKLEELAENLTKNLKKELPTNEELEEIKQAQKSGCQSIQGLEMFIHQGLEQFKLWTGIELNAVEAREVVLGCMG